MKSLVASEDEVAQVERGVLPELVGALLVRFVAPPVPQDCYYGSNCGARVLIPTGNMRPKKHNECYVRVRRGNAMHTSSLLCKPVCRKAWESKLVNSWSQLVSRIYPRDHLPKPPRPCDNVQVASGEVKLKEKNLAANA